MSFLSKTFQDLSNVVSTNIANLQDIQANSNGAASNSSPFSQNSNNAQNDALSGGGQMPSNDPFLNRHINVEGKNYYVQAGIAAGGFAVVYKVQDTSDNQIRALKRLLVNSENKKSVLQEVSLVKRLSGITKHVTQYFGATTQGSGEVLLVTELCVGQIGVIYTKPSLNAHLPQTVARVLFQIATGVNAIHSIGVTHRDLKIENLLLGQDGKLKICDFGSATNERWTPDDSWSHHQRCLLEEQIQQATTPMYRTPEVLDLYSNHPIDEKQDCWAIGCLVFMLCFKKHPFEDGQRLGIIHGNYKIPENTPFAQFVPYIKRMLTIDPRNRPSAKEFAQKLLQQFGNEISTKPILNEHQLAMLSAKPARAESPASQPVGGSDFGGAFGLGQGANQAEWAQKHIQGGVSQAKNFFSTIKTTVQAKQQQLFEGNSTAQLVSKVTSRLYVTYFPQEGARLDQIRQELNNRFGSSYQVYNLASKRYHLNKFYNRCVDASWSPNNVESDHHTPTLEHLSKICINIYEFLEKNRDNVVVLHSFGVPDRNTALVVAAMLQIEGLVKTVEQAMWYYADRVAPPKLSITPSQQRTLFHVRQVTMGKGPDPDFTKRLRLKKISLQCCPGFSRDRRTVRPFFEVQADNQQIFTTFRSFENTLEYAAGAQVQADLGQVLLPVDKVAQITAFHARQILGGRINIDKMTNVRMFSTSFDPAMINAHDAMQSFTLSVERGELDTEVNGEAFFSRDFELKVHVQVEKNHQKVKAGCWSRLANVKNGGLLADTQERQQILSNYGNLPGMVAKDLSIQIQPPAPRGQYATIPAASAPSSGRPMVPSESEDDVDTSQYQQITADAPQDDGNFLGFDPFADAAVAQQPAAIPQAPGRTSSLKRKDEDEFDLLGGLSLDDGVSAKPAQATPSAMPFDPFWGGGPAETIVTTKAAPPSGNSMTANLLDFGASPPPVNTAKPQAQGFDPFADFMTSTSSTKPAATSQKFDPFANFDFSTPAPAAQKPTTTTAGPPSRGTSPVTTKTTQPTSQKQPPKKSTFDFDMSGFGFTESKPQGPQTLGAAKDKELEVNMNDPVQFKIYKWTQGKENNIRALLSSLQDILWEGENRWKKITLADMLEFSQVKKQYRKASLIVHPDRTTGKPWESLAREIQIKLNEAYKKFEDENQG